MSYRIEYQFAAFVAAHPDGTPRFVIGVEGGDNNLYDTFTNKRSRSWSACFLGTATQVLKQAVHFAGACEGGCLKPLGRDATPESYIRRIRRLIEEPTATAHGYWCPSVDVPKDHPLVNSALAIKLDAITELRYGKERILITVPADRTHLVFDFKDQHPDLHAWNLAQVRGLPSS